MVQEQPLTHPECQPDITQTEHVIKVRVHRCLCEHWQPPAKSPCSHRFINCLRSWKTHLLLLLCFIIFAVCATLITYWLLQTDIFHNVRHSLPPTLKPLRQYRARVTLRTVKALFMKPPVNTAPPTRPTRTSRKRLERECRNKVEKFYLSNKFVCVLTISQTRSAADARRQCLKEIPTRLTKMNSILEYYNMLFKLIKALGKDPYLVLNIDADKENLKPTYCQMVRNPYVNLQPKEDACFIASNKHGRVCFNSEPKYCKKARPAFCIYDPQAML